MSKNCAKAKPKIMSHITFNKLFFNNDDMCRNNVYTCSQCSHQVYLFAGTIFQDNKLPLYTLLV